MTTPLATPPSRADSVNFAARADSFLASLLQFQTEMDALGASTEFNKNYVASAWQAAGGITVGLGQAVAAAATASAAADRAEAAWAAAAAPAEKLAAMAQSLHVGAIVKAFLYDTSKDSDGGAWRQRCQHTVWYQEAIQTGDWLGQQATAAAAWATSGAASGDYFQNSTDGKYYALGATSPAVTEVFRGGSRGFPAVVGIVAETARVVIYDLTAPGCPMWRVFGTTADAASGDWWRVNRAATSLVAKDGTVFIGLNTNADGYSVLLMAKFAHGWLEKLGAYVAASARSQFTTPHLSVTAAFPGYLAAMGVNDIAVTVLENAPVDPATGLPVPTIAVATAGGGSIIRNDGVVVNTANTNNMTSVAMASNGDVYFGTSAASNIIFSAAPQSAGHGVSRYTATTVPAVSASVSSIPVLAGALLAAGNGAGLYLLKENPSAPTRGMVARITNAFNSGWQVGDSRGAWLADTVAETITAPELVTNGTFNSDIAGVVINTNGGTGQAVWGSGGTLNLSGDGTISIAATLPIATEVGRTYKVTFDLAGNGAAAGIATAVNSGFFVTSTVFPVQAGNSITFTAVGTTSYLIFNKTSVSVANIDNVSCKRVDADRSVKNNPLSIIGSIVKESVAAGAQVQRYRGFTPANYFEQAYSANLDYGTGDFHYMWWDLITNPTADQVRRFGRSVIGAAGALSAYSGVGGVHTLGIGGSNVVSGVVQQTGWCLLAWVRESGVLKLYVNGVPMYSVANSANLTDSGAVLRIGTDTGATPVWNGPLGMAMFRTGATAPSADQIAKIYRDELALFQPGAQCTLAGTSNIVTAMAYDDGTDLLQVATSWGRSSFHDLVRVDSEATTVGAVTTITAQSGAVVMGGTSGRIYQPALTLRDELRRKREARLALGRTPVFFEFDATASQTTFALPDGYTVKAVYSAGTLKRLGTTKDYTVTDDGFGQFVVFGTGLAASTWVSVMVVRT